MAKMSLQEQLLKSGLVSSGQAKAVKSEKYKQAKQPVGHAITDEVKLQAQKVQLEKAERDRELNQRRQQEEGRKQLAAQVKQLIEQHRLPKKELEKQRDESLAYHFTDSNKVKTLYVSNEIRNQIAQGRLAIVKLGNQYELVTAEIAGKIKARDENSVIVFNETTVVEKSQVDPYSDFQIPDDLMW